VELLPQNAQVVQAYTTYAGGRWQVVIVRPLASVHPLMSSLASDFSAAFATWDGGKGERGGLKATSGWISFTLERPAAPARVETVTQAAPTTVTATQIVETSPTWAWVVIGVLIAVIAILLGLAFRRK